MGSFYTSHTIRGPSQKQLLEWLADRSAYVSTTDRSVTTVLDEECESQDGESLASLAQQLSEHFKCAVLAVLNHDDDILYFELYENGEKTDEYNSSPAYFGEEVEDDGPAGGNASRLAAAFGASNQESVEAVLRKSDYVFATERHRDLFAALGLPAASVGLGFSYVEAGDLPPWAPNGYFARSGSGEA